jgi:outer membrane autotransporter protein
MNPVKAGDNNSDYYATSSGSPTSTNFGMFALLSGTMPGTQSASGIPGQQMLSGGVNMADGDTLDVFATSGQLYGNANYNSTPVTGSRFLVDFDLKTRTADSLWFGDIRGNVSVIPRFNYVAAGTAATYDPDGIRFATIVANPDSDNSVIVDYQSYFNQKDITYVGLPNTQGDQGLYRAFVVYRKDGGASSANVNGDTTSFSSKAATGGYFLTFLPDTEFYQLASMGSAVQEAVRDTTASYHTRQADLRDAVGDNIAGGWLRISGSHAKLMEDVSYKFLPQAPGLTRTVGNYYTQTTVDITAGGDAVAALGKGKVVLGAAVGYTDSDVRFLGLGYGGVSGGQVSAPIPFIPRYDENRTAMEGYHIGAYGSYIQDQFFVDGSLSYTSLDLHSLFATLANDVFSTNSKTIDATVLSGMRFVADDVFSVEPVVGLSYMETEQDDINFGVAYGATAVNFPKFRSLRPGIGARVKVASATDLYKLNLGLGVMWWHELKDDGSRVKATSGGNSFSVADLRGGMETVAIDTSANMIFANGLSSFIDVSAHGNQDAYLDVGFSAGARYRW